jgi:hypothetical protein
MYDNPLYEVEIGYNADSDYNPKFYFDDREQMLAFVEIITAHGHRVIISEVHDEE